MKKIAMLAAVIGLCSIAYSQTTDEENIKRTVRAETEKFFNLDLEGWKATWTPNAKHSRTFISNTSYRTESNWDSSLAFVQAQFKQLGKPLQMQITTTNYHLLQKGDMAWVEFDQVLSGPGIDTTLKNGNSREYRVLVREGGQWKITSQITTFPESYKISNAMATENDLNAAGYRFIADNKIDHAIEVLKLNVQLFPDSYNAFDSLGEAYALAGDKKKAIENYEKSIKLNPKNESGVMALQKLKQE